MSTRRGHQDDDPASPAPTTITFENLTPGAYPVSAHPLTLHLSGAGCTDSDAGGVASVPGLNPVLAAINLEAGETVVGTLVGVFDD